MLLKEVRASETLDELFAKLKRISKISNLERKGDTIRFSRGEYDFVLKDKELFVVVDGRKFKIRKNVNDALEVERAVIFTCQHGTHYPLAESALYVVGEVDLNYVDDNQTEKNGTVTIYVSVSSNEEAESVSKKLNGHSFDAVDYADTWGQNAFDDFSAPHGNATVKSVKISTTKPSGRKAFEVGKADL